MKNTINAFALIFIVLGIIGINSIADKTFTEAGFFFPFLYMANVGIWGAILINNISDNK